MITGDREGRSYFTFRSPRFARIGCFRGRFFFAPVALALLLTTGYGSLGSRTLGGRPRRFPKAVSVTFFLLITENCKPFCFLFVFFSACWAFDLTVLRIFPGLGR